MTLLPLVDASPDSLLLRLMLPARSLSPLLLLLLLLGALSLLCVSTMTDDSVEETALAALEAGDKLLVLLATAAAAAAAASPMLLSLPELFSVACSSMRHCQHRAAQQQRRRSLEAAAAARAGLAQGECKKGLLLSPSPECTTCEAKVHGAAPTWALANRYPVRAIVKNSCDRLSAICTWQNFSSVSSCSVPASDVPMLRTVEHCSVPHR